MARKRPRSAATRSLELYEVLGVSPTATQSEIQRSYKVLAVRVHPDKNPGDACAKAAFQQLQRAYEVLRDPRRRQEYDDYGTVDGEEGEVASAVREATRAWRGLVTPEAIAAFELEYRGSEEEREDVAAFVQKQEGDVRQLFEHVFFGRPDEDMGRFSTMIEELFTVGRLPERLRASVAETLPRLRRSAKALARRSRREAKELEAEEAATQASVRKPGGDLGALALVIQQRQQERSAAFTPFLDQLEAKYSAGQGGPSRKRTKGDRDAPPREKLVAPRSGTARKTRPASSAAARPGKRAA